MRYMRRCWSVRGRLLAGLAGVALAAAAGSAAAQDRIVDNPRVLGAPLPSAGLEAAAPPPPLALTGTASKDKSYVIAPATTPDTGDRRLNLNVVYTDGQLYNPANGRNDKVHLRSYNGADVSATTPYVAPTILVRPGDTVRVALDNKLPADPSCTDPNWLINVPHCYNGTNLHSHGLWVSPTGNSDNVLLSINPGVQFEYEYNIPRDHPAGTFWYHTHRHGSTALQVSSGMAGALVIKGDRKPTPKTNGDLDTLLYKGSSPIPEKLLVFQQIQYACLDANGNIKVREDAKGNVVEWVCDPGDTGVIEFYSDANGNGFGPGSWGQSGRYTSINGQVLATLPAKAGELARWRMIHAGVRDTISLQFVKMAQGGAEALERLAAADGEKFRETYCVGDPVPFYIVADDGLTDAQARKTVVATLQPGYRNDLLVVFPKAGNYCMLDADSSLAGSVNNVPVGTRLLGKVAVAPGQEVADIPAFVTKELVAAANTQMPADVRASVVADLQAGLKLTRFVPHPTISDAEVKGQPVEKVLFNIAIPGQNTNMPVQFEVGSQDYAPRPYAPDRVDRTLVLGTAQEWELKSEFVSHPFHIHVNPFQIVKILDPDGKDVSEPGAKDTFGIGGDDPQYPGLKGVWKDTLWVKSAQKVKNGPYFPYTLVVRTRYQRYIGEYVLHCHILDHEDQGMMQNVQIVLPDGAGGVSHGHH
ncbi:multicopper oxidase family protein [Caulobacter hibisci]|nr:multicopper oxidase family protein [Caulobacter hibisci]